MVSAKSPSAASVRSPPQTFTRTILTSNLVSNAINYMFLPHNYLITRSKKHKALSDKFHAGSY